MSIKEKLKRKFTSLMLPKLIYEICYRRGLLLSCFSSTGNCLLPDSIHLEARKTKLCYWISYKKKFIVDCFSLQLIVSTQWCLVWSSLWISWPTGTWGWTERDWRYALHLLIELNFPQPIYTWEFLQKLSSGSMKLLITLNRVWFYKIYELEL